MIGRLTNYVSMVCTAEWQVRTCSLFQGNFPVFVRNCDLWDTLSCAVNNFIIFYYHHRFSPNNSFRRTVTECSHLLYCCVCDDVHKYYEMPYVKLYTNYFVNK
jgi:hypothetical protein